MDAVAHGRSNIAPIKIPWDLIRTLITETYGGKVDNDSDFKLLAGLVESVMTPAAFEVDHILVDGGANSRTDAPNTAVDNLKVPEGSEMKDFTQWVDRLPEREPPSYLGLPANAEKLLLVGQGATTIANVHRITEILDESEQLMMEAEDVS